MTDERPGEGSDPEAMRAPGADGAEGAPMRAPRDDEADQVPESEPDDLAPEDASRM